MAIIKHSTDLPLNFLALKRNVTLLILGSKNIHSWHMACKKISQILKVMLRMSLCEPHKVNMAGHQQILHSTWE